MNPRKLFSFLNIQNSHARDERPSVFQLCQKQYNLLKQTMPLLAVTELKIEREKLQMIGWLCGVFLKSRRTREQLRKLVVAEPITTVIRSS